MDKESLEKMEEVETFLDDLIEDYQECGQLHFDEDCVSVMYGYAAALINWEKDGNNPGSWFSTDNELFLKYREQLQEKFRLPIMTREDGEAHEEEMKKLLTVYRHKTGLWN